MLERSALERFVEDYADRAYRFAYGLCGNEADARELTQEAFVRVFDKAALFDESRPFENWFFTVLRNLYYDGTRRWERRALPLDAPVGEEGLTVADVLPDAREEALFDRLSREEGRSRLRQVLEGLDAEPRALLLMVDAEGLSYEDAGRVLGCPAGTVRSRLCRARRALRRRLLAMEARP